MSAALSYGAGLFEVGYIKKVFKRTHLFGTLGTGHVGMTMKLHSILSDQPFDSVLTNPNRSSTISTGGFCLSLNGGVLVRLSSFFILGVKAGYIYAPEKADWRFENGYQVLGGPDVNLSVPYFSLNFYFGGIGEE